MVMLWQVIPGSLPKTRLCSDNRPAVSAFAARKAARRPIADVTSQIEEQTSLVTETYNDPVEGSKPPRKKQKLGNEPKDKNPRPPQLRDGLVKVQGGSIEVGVKDIESGNGSDSSSVDEPEILVQPTFPVQRLSTFDPSRSSVLSETETEWTVRLNPNDVSVSRVFHYTLQHLKPT